MNINKNKSIRKGFVFSKTIFPAVGAWLMVTQMGCSESQGLHNKLDTILYINNKNKIENTNDIIITQDQINKTILMSHGTNVCSTARKFILPISKLGTSYEFTNPTDQSKQKLNGDGKDVLIINNPTKAEIKEINGKIRQLGLNEEGLSLSQISELITYMEVNKILDFYNSDKQYVEECLTKIKDNTVDEHAYFGVYRRKRDDCEAVFVEGKIKFQGGYTESPQVFNNGVVFVIDQNDNIIGVQPEKFEETYTYPSEQPIKVANLKQVTIFSNNTTEN